jgi:predicted nuclease of restriction endonuclease-like (RecB) superfamily
MNQDLLTIPTTLIGDIRGLIDSAKSRIARSVNQEMTLLYWHIGKRIQEEILHNERADYGEKIIYSLASQLQEEYGKGFSKTNLFEMVRLFDIFPHFEIFQTLSGKLCWSHFVVLLNIKDPLKRDFYAEMCRIDGWSVRTLREKIGKLLYERTALSKQPDAVISDSLALVKENNRLVPGMILQDPYVLEFLNLPQNYGESDLESAILDEVQRFLIEMGAGFCFVARQKRITVGRTDYWIDLLLYNRYLRRLVAVELKNTPFKPAHKGQMEFYLRWLNQHERRGDDEVPLGIILCTETDQEQIQLFDLDASGIHVAEYITELPPPDVFAHKVQDIVMRTRERLAPKTPLKTPMFTHDGDED